MTQQEFEKVSVDLIFARSSTHTLQSWEKELQYALSLKPGHISLYQLTIEPQTRFFREFQKNPGKFAQFHLKSISGTFASDDQAADLYEHTLKIMKEYGYDRYEVSNFALHERDQSQHNLWGWKGLSYIGIGPGACGRLWGKTETKKVKRGFRQYRSPETWMKTVQSQSHGTQQDFQLNFEERMQELLLSGLRMKNGIHDSLWKFHSDGLSVDQVLKVSCVERAVENGLIEWIPNQYFLATEKGRSVLDSLLIELELLK